MSDPFSLGAMNLAYDRLRAIKFPVPAPAATVDVGTFDAATGKFAFSTAVKRETANVNTPPSGDTGGKPDSETEYYLAVNAVRVSLRFRVAHPQGAVSADVNGVTWPGSAQGAVTADIGTASDATFAITSGPKTFTPGATLNIVRPPIIGVGAFLIPEWPVLIVYDPPADRNKRNHATYTETHKLGVSTSMTFSSEQTIAAKFLTPAQLTDNWVRSLDLIAGGYDFFIQKGGDIGTSLDPKDSAAKNLELYTTPVKDALAALPSASFQSSEARADSNEHTLDTEITSTTTIQTQGGLGPGLGDVIVYLANVRVIWSFLNGDVSLSVLDWEDVVYASAQSIRSEVQRLEQLPVGGGADAGGGRTLASRIASLKGLLALDPLTQGASPRGNPRFAGADDDPRLKPKVMTGPDSQSFQFSHAVTQTDKNQHVDTDTQTEDQSPGFLSILLPFLGDPTKTTSITTKTSRTSSAQVTVGETVSAQVNLYADLGEHYVVTTYYDGVFNTFAFDNTPDIPTMTISGQLQGTLTANSPSGQGSSAEPGNQ